MNLINHRVSILFRLVMVSFLSSCSALVTPAVGQSHDVDTLEPNKCLPPIYSDFSYPIESDKEKISVPGLDTFVLPSSPWQIETPLPEFPGITNWETRRVDVTQTRRVQDYFEVWIHISQGLEEQGYLAVYRTDKKEWTIIPEQINTLIVDKSGSLWGSRSGVGSVPFDNRILSKFNEKTNTFTVVEAVQNLASGIEKTGSYFYNQVILDNEGLFWILVPEDGIYRYNPVSGEVKRFFDLPTTFIDASVAADGTIYVLIYDQFIKAENLITQSFLNFYVPKTGETSSIALNYLLEPYPYPFSLLIDHKDRIWLDNIAYIDENGVLYQIQRSPLFISPLREFYSDYRYKRANIILESSDGRLWFLHPTNGMIFLDPEKSEWCWFTTYKSNIAEDSDHNLWMIADNQLYRYALNQ
ncbi:MAG: hypothetical protein ABIQ77_02560 [Anaerolineales bacterium]